MFSAELSNGTRLGLSIDFKAKALIITQTPSGSQTVAPELMANNRLTVPLGDLKSLAASIKSLVGFFT